MKETLRKEFMLLRKNADPETCRELSDKAQDKFLESDLYKNCKNLMAYLPLGKETATDKIITCAISQGKKILVPVTNEETCIITPVIYTADSTLKKGGFSVTEPQNSVPFPPEEIDLVIVPGIAYSGSGGRIGFGKGCYDRFLTKTTSTKVGFCYDFQLTDKICPDKNDVLMDYIITEKGVFPCKK